jgi:hypothetical protein
MSQPYYGQQPPPQPTVVYGQPPQPQSPVHYQQVPVQYGQPVQYQQPVQYAQPVQYQQAGVQYQQPIVHATPPQYSEEAPLAHTEDGKNGNYIDPPPQVGWRDKWFVLAFLIHAIGIIIIAGVYGGDLVHSSSDNGVSVDTDNSDFAAIIGLCVVAAIVGTISAVVWLGILRRHAEGMIKLSIIVNVILVLICCVISFAIGLFVTAVIYIIYLLIIAWWYYSVRSRIPFSESIIRSSIEALYDNNGSFYVSYLISFVQLVWLAFWSFTFASALYAANSVDAYGYSNGSSASKFSAFYCVFSLYWTAQTFRNVSHVTVSGSVSSWWFLPQETKATRGAFVRSLTTSLGSIIFGSLLVALIQFVRFLLRQTGGNHLLACIADCILGIFERMLRWFNKFAFVLVAMYGYDFLTSAKATKDLLQTKFWDLLINDNLSGMVIWMGTFISGVVAAIVCGIWAYAADLPAFMWLALLALFIGILMASIIMSVLDSAITTTIVTWAENPAAMQANRPEQFNRMNAAAVDKYGAMYSEYMQTPHQPRQMIHNY